MDVTIAPPGIPTSGFQFLSVNSVAIDGERFDTGTGTLMGPTAGTGVAESFDITRIRKNNIAVISRIN